jgi:hypothetical protein
VTFPVRSKVHFVINCWNTGSVDLDIAPGMRCVRLSVLYCFMPTSRQGIVPKCINGLTASEVNSELEQAKGPNPWSV